MIELLQSINESLQCLVFLLFAYIAARFLGLLE